MPLYSSQKRLKLPSIMPGYAIKVFNTTSAEKTTNKENGVFRTRLVPEGRHEFQSSSLVLE